MSMKKYLMQINIKKEINLKLVLTIFINSSIFVKILD